MIELSKNILQKSLNVMEENSYKNLCLMEKSTTNPFAYVNISDINIKKLVNGAYNKNAKYVSFTFDKIKYLRFQVSINLNTREDNKDRKNGLFDKMTYMILKERSLMNRNTAELYVNGLKVPDMRALVTLFSGSTDFFIPIDLIKSENPQVDIVVNKFNNKTKYYNAYSNKINGNKAIKVPFIKNIEGFSSDCLRIYINGLLVNDFLVEEDIIYLGEEVSAPVLGDDVEIIYRCDTVYKNVSTPENKVLNFPKDVLKVKPIFSDVCECYLNGVRQFPRSMNNLSPRNISLENFKNGDVLTSYVCHNEDVLTDKNLYIDDLTRFFNYKFNDASTILNGEYTGFLPEYIENIKFPPKVIKIIDEDRNKFQETVTTFLEAKTKEYIKENVENYKFLLNNCKSINTDFIFSSDYLTDHIRKDTSKELGQVNFTSFNKDKVVFQFNLINDEPYNSYIVFKNNKRIDIEGKYEYFRYRNNNFLYVDKELFEDAKTIRVMQLPVYNKKYKYVVFSLSEGNNQVIIPKKDLGYIRSLNDCLVLKNNNVIGGWNAFYNYNLEEDNDNIIINMNNAISLDRQLRGGSNPTFIIYNCSFTEEKTMYIKEEDVKLNEATMLTYDLELPINNTYPSISFYAPLVFRNGELLINRKDYRILSQFNNEMRTICELALCINCKAGDEIKIVYTEGFYDSVGSVDYINSEYGVVYFDDLIFPFDSGYLDLYVDGKLVDPSNIEVISSNMIRVNNVENLVNVGVQSKLNLPLYIFKEYTETFYSNPSLWDEYIKFYYYDRDKTDEFYLELNPDAEKVKSDPESSDPRINILANAIANAFINGIIPRLINCNIYYDFSRSYGLKELMIDRKDYVEINCNKYQLVTATEINAEKTLKTREEVLDAIARHTDDGILDANNDIPSDSELWNEIYPDEIEQVLL